MKTCTQCNHTGVIEVAKDSDTITTQCSRCGHIQLWLNIAVIHTGPHVNPPELWAPVAREDGDTLKVTGVPCDPPWGRLDIPREEPSTQHAFQVIKSGRVILDEFAILKIPYTQKVRIDRKDYFQGIRNGVQRRFLCDESRYHYFPTWNEAWAHLCALAQAEVTAAESALAHAKETLAAAKAMRPDW